MAIVLDPQEPAINRGIKSVGIGKKGSQSLTSELVAEILQDLKAGKVSDAAKGAFFAGLCAKGVEPQEEILIDTFGKDDILSDAPAFAQWICKQLSAGHTLDYQTSYDLGRFLFSDEPGDAARGWIASFLRVRYETGDEYAGLLRAMEETLEAAYKTPAPAGAPIVQISEPFDGVDHSYMITPLLGAYVQALGYRVVHQVGENSGPKLEMNLSDIARSLGEPLAGGNADLVAAKPRYGWFFHQSMMSAALKRWVSLRHQTIKRPFLATLERFVNPLKSEYLIASAFHPPYGEKMLGIAERAGFQRIVIVRNGMEGSIAFPLLREVKLLLSARQSDGNYLRHELVLDHGRLVEAEDKVEKPKAVDNARLIAAHTKNGSSANQHFDVRVKITCEGLRRALDWLKG